MRKRLAEIDGHDALLASGLLLLTAGVGLLSVPAALIVCGGLLFALAMLPLVLPVRGRDG
jgi:hypothetical protein